MVTLSGAVLAALPGLAVILKANTLGAFSDRSRQQQASAMAKYLAGGCNQGWLWLLRDS